MSKFVVRSDAPRDPVVVSILRLYLRVLGLLAPERRLAITLALANLALAGVYFLEPMLFGRVVDALAAPGPSHAPRLIALWALAGFGGVIASVWVSLHADRLAHRRRLAAIAAFFEHAAALPLAFHGEHHTGRLARIMNNGVNNLFNLWLSFFREHLATLLSIFVMIPVALVMNWKLALLMIALMISFAVSNAITVQRTHKAQGEVEELHHEIATRTGDVFGNVIVVQSFTRLSAEATALKEMMTRVLAAQYPVLRGWAILSVLNRAASTALHGLSFVPPPAARLRWSVRPALARPPRSACPIAPTTHRADRSRSMVTISVLSRLIRYARILVWCSRIRACSNARSSTTCAWASRMPTSSRSKRPSLRPKQPRSSPTNRKDWRPSSPNVGAHFPAVSASVWRSPAPC
jgi:ABC-type multidrug transport system fused ATPase/permease subunit